MGRGYYEATSWSVNYLQVQADRQRLEGKENTRSQGIAQLDQNLGQPTEIEMDGMNRVAAAHEMFHILGLDHANGLRCTQNGSPVPIADQCTSMSYGDPFDNQVGCRPVPAGLHRKTRRCRTAVSSTRTKSLQFSPKTIPESPLPTD